MRKDFQLEFKDNEIINCTVFYPSQKVISKTIVFVHGFKGFKDWGFGPYLSEYFRQKGFCVVAFNFSLNGIGNDFQNFTEFDKFARNTISREIDELNFIIEHVSNNTFADLSTSKIGLLGHSRGGAVSILTAAQNKQINALCTWAAVSKFDRFSKRQKEEWQKKKVLEVINARTNQVMKMNYSYLKDILENKDDKLNIEKSLSSLQIPLLICHGEQDIAVPVKEGEKLYSWSIKERTEFFSIPKTGHTFDIKHPFEGSNEKFEKLLSKTSDFFTKFLN